MGMYDENVGTNETPLTAEQARELGLSIVDLDELNDPMKARNREMDREWDYLYKE